MEGTDSPGSISINPRTIKKAQQEMGRLDVLVCGQCHSVFHFIEELQEHKSKDGVCSKQSNFRENSSNEPKAQVWAFLLWKDTQIQSDSLDKDSTNSWKLYQKWCNMDSHIRDCWITAGKTIQTFTKISNTKMQEVPQQQGTVISDGGRTIVVRKVIRNGQPDNSEKKEFKTEMKIKSEPIDNKSKGILKPLIKPKGKINKPGDNDESSDEEYVIEKILAKRFNDKKMAHEYLLKWEGYTHDYNTWQEVSHVKATCKQLVDEFEEHLAKKKEKKVQGSPKPMNRANQIGVNVVGQKVIKVEGAGSSSSSGRPMRSSKTKAMDQVKQWCGSMKDEGILNKRKIAFSDSDSDEDGIGGLSSAKRNKIDTSGDDDWTADSEEDKTMIGRSDVIQRAFNRAQSNGSNRSSGSEVSNNMLANVKGVKVEQSKPSNVYIVHRKDGIIKLDSSPSNKITVKGPTTQTIMVQQRDGNIVRKQVVAASNSTGGPVRVITKPDGTQVVTQIKVTPKGSPGKTGATPKSEPVKIQPKPDPNKLQPIHVVTAIPSPLGVQQQRVTQTSIRPTGVRSAIEGRPLLPRPTTGIRASTPATSSGVMTITQTRTPVRAPPPKQLTPQSAQQRQQILQKRATIVQVASPTASLPSVKPKITVMSQQNKVLQKSVVSPLAAAKGSLKPGTPMNKPQSLITPQQKMLLARRKVAEQAGVVSKPGTGRGGATPGSRGTATLAGRGRGGISIANKPKESKLADTDGLHMEFHQIESESSSDEVPEFPTAPAEPAQPEPESPPRLTLCPLTGRIIGPDGQPVDPEPEQTVQQVNQSTMPGTATINADGTITTNTNEAAELVLPSLEGLTDGSGGIVSVQMSPGGTTGTLVQQPSDAAAPIALASVAVPGPGLPCLDDPSIEVQTTSSGGVVLNVTSAAASTASAAAAPETTTTVPVSESSDVTTTAPTTEATATEPKQDIGSSDVETVMAAPVATNIKMEEKNGILTITGDDGMVYQVTGQGDDGRTLLVQGADGQQQCVYVTSTDQQGEESTVLTLDTAVAEAMAAQMDHSGDTPQFYVKEGIETADAVGEGAVAAEDNQQMVMSVVDNGNAAGGTDAQEDAENQAQVVAQVIQAEEPNPDGTRRVVLLLPDGSMMMTEVDESQYAALELDK